MLMGVNFYGYRWCRTPSGALGAPDAVTADGFFTALRARGAKLRWQDDVQEHRLQYKARAHGAHHSMCPQCSLLTG
jgi:hypothetical protein